MMKPFLTIFFMLFITVSAVSQKSELSEYNYVIVPDIFEFQPEPDQYELNSMTLFYLNKSGFNAFPANNAPKAARCEGLYADVEKLGSLLGARLQVILRDCNNNEVYRSEIGGSKIKDYERGFQDALRRAFSSIERLGVKQKELSSSNSLAVNSKDAVRENSNPIVGNTSEGADVSGSILPNSKFSTYTFQGKFYLLRKTEEGYSFYEESAASENGLNLMGKIIIMEKVLRYMDSSGNVFDATFDAAGNLTIKDSDNSYTYHFQS